MKVLLLQLDGSLPNIALMRIASHHRAMGDSVELRKASTRAAVACVVGGGRDGSGRSQRGFWEDEPYGKVYASAIFEKTRPVVDGLLAARPDATVGGTGFDLTITLEGLGIATKAQDYSIYPGCSLSIGFSQRGCRLRCPFCVAPRKEPDLFEENTIAGIWRGEGHPRDIVLLDNDFFGQTRWSDRIEEMKAGRFRVSFNQGINARMITDEGAAAIAGVDYRRVDYKRQCLGTRGLYCAWDNRKDEARLFRGLELLTKHGVKPRHISVYVLIGYDHASKSARPFLVDDDFHRRAQLREFGALPYPMPFVRTRELVGFQRWVVGAYDKRVTWSDWEAADYEPRKLGLIA